MNQFLRPYYIYPPKTTEFVNDLFYREPIGVYSLVLSGYIALKTRSRKRNKKRF
jgi:hypothetical protein